MWKFDSFGKLRIKEAILLSAEKGVFDTMVE